MSVIVEIPDPLAAQAAAAAKSHATSLEKYVIEAVAKTVAEEPASSVGEERDPVFGFFAADSDLMDAIVEHAMTRRRTAPARTPSE